MPKILEQQKSVAFLAGVVCYLIAFSVLVALPSILTDADENKVVGEDGVARDVHDRTPAQQEGRHVYEKQVCWHCHSDFVRPVNDEVARWGPVSQSGEYAFDLPHLFGTRRTGPDLHREGGLRIADWHFAHFANPRFTVPHSVMPGFTWLFYDRGGDLPQAREVLALMDVNGDGMFSTSIGDAVDADALRRALTARGKIYPEAAGETKEQKEKRETANALTMDLYQHPAALDRFGLYPPSADTKSQTDDPMQWVERAEIGDGLLTDYDLRPMPTDEAKNIVDFIDHQGTSIGKWRRPLYVTAPVRVSPFSGADDHPRRSPSMRVFGWKRDDPKAVKAAEDATAAYEKAVLAWNEKYPRLAERLGRGKELFTANCAGCHGEQGRGAGSAAQFMQIRPRDFTLAKYKFRSTPVGKLPTDGDLYRSIFRGLPGTAMPPWKELADEQIWTLVDYVKTFYEGDKAFNERDAVTPIMPQRFDPNPQRELARGRAVYLSSFAQCYNCHGKQGRADGPGWNDARTDFGNFLRPRDFRPRLRDEWAPELWTLLGRSLEHLLGADAWKKVSGKPEFTALEPKGPEKTKAFVLFLLGEGPRLFDVLGGETLKDVVGEDRYAKWFDRVHDALDEVRMAVATEKDQPALRLRGGAAPEDIYRTVFNGIEGTQMKMMFDGFWKKMAAEFAGRDDLSKRERVAAWTSVIGTEYKLSYVTGEKALHEVGVYDKPNDKGQTEEFIKFQAADDWALMHYVMWLECIPVPRSGD